MRRQMRAAGRWLVPAVLTCIAALSAAPATAVQPRLVNAKVEAATLGSRSLEQLVSSLTGADPVLVGWSVAKQPGQGDVCCYSNRSRGCRLDGDARNLTVSSGDVRTVSLVDGGRLLVFLQVRGGRVERVTALSEDCEADAGGERTVWLDEVPAPRSVALLRAIAERGGDRGKRSVDDQALAALAMHADGSAEVALEELAARPGAARQNAVFWLGESRGEAGLTALEKLRRARPDAEALEQIAFALSQNRTPGALAELRDMARAEPTAAARSKALFWLGQRGGAEAEQAIVAAVRGDADLQVRRDAVFALSQLPDRRGTDLLLQTLRESRDREVRQQALFWLGQSEDPRAQDALEAILLK